MEKELGARNGSDADTSSTYDHYEEGREWVRNTNPQGVTSHQSGVDVERAEQDFLELSRQFSSISQQAHRLSKHASRASKPVVESKDLEKSGTSTDSDEPWDLETSLRGSQDAEKAAGIKNKHIGECLSHPA